MRAPTGRRSAAGAARIPIAARQRRRPRSASAAPKFDGYYEVLDRDGLYRVMQIGLTEYAARRGVVMNSHGRPDPNRPQNRALLPREPT